MNDLPLVPRDRTASAVVPFVPLDYLGPGMSVAQTSAIVWAHRRFSILIVLIVASLTALALTLWPRTYTATASLMVNYEVNDPLNGKELPVGQVASYIATQVELMQTPEVLLTVVERLALTQDPEYTRGYRDGSGTLKEWVATQVGKTLAVFQSQRGSQLIYVTFSADTPGRAAEVVNMVVQVYKEQDQQRAAGPPAERALRYTQQLDGLKAKVDQAQQQVTAFHQRNGLIDAGIKTNVDALLLSTLDERLLAAQSARRMAEARASQEQAVSDPVLASTQAQALKTQLGTQEQRLAELNRHYTPLYPDVREAELQVEATRRAISLTVQSYADNAAANRNIAQRLEQALQRTVEDQRARILAKSRLEDEAAKTRLELESAQVVYRRALESYDQIMFASSGRNANVSLVSRATPPVRAAKPRVLILAVLGGGAALLLGLGVPLVYERFNRRVRCRDDLERQYGVPVLAEFGRLVLRPAP